MNLKDAVPLLIYDDKCYVCTKFAKIAYFLSHGEITLIGHYTNLGEKLRKEILDSTALSMFWFVDDKIAYGGRAALLPLFLSILRRRGNKTTELSEQVNYPLECKNPKAVFLRSASLITNYKKIKIKNNKISF